MKIQDIVETGSNISYRDILPSHFYANYAPTQDCQTFLKNLRRYENINKIDISALTDRISALSEVNNSVSDSNIFLSGIQKGIIKKQNHLISLQRLFETGVVRNRKELYNPEIKTLFEAKDKKLLSLKNDIIYDFDVNVLLGLYVLEAIDPAHRFTVVKYIDQWKSSHKRTPFFMYLEKNSVYDLIPQIKYFSNEERQDFKINVKTGLLYHSSGQLLTTDNNKEYLFVLTKDNELYGCYSRNGIKHTSLSQGDIIKCGGAFGAKNGRLLWINLDSGHYFPTLKHLKNLADYFEQNDINVSDNLKVCYHENYTRKSVTFKQGVERQC